MYQQTRSQIEQGETSCRQLVLSYLAQINAQNPTLNAFLSIDEEGALQQADALDKAFADGNAPPLAGLVMGIKDVIAVKQKPLTCGSHMLENFTSLYDATAIQKLRAAGAIFIGKLNCDEFAMGSSNENSYFGAVKNPKNIEMVPGGSSGGSAAAVAAEMCAVSLGTDTGGSIRQPAAFCGIYGLKPTYGRVSRMGLVAYGSSFDCMGPMATNLEDLADVFQVMAGHDEWDATSANQPVPNYKEAFQKEVKGLKIGLPKEYFGEGLDPEIQAALHVQAQKLTDLGAEIVEVSLPHTQYGIATYYILTTAEASSNLGRYDGVRFGHRAEMGTLKAELQENENLLTKFYEMNRTEGFGWEVKKRIMLGTYVLSAGYYDAYYGKAQKVRRLIKNDFDAVFQQVDALLTPAAPTTAFPLGQKYDDPIAEYLNDVYTVSANLAGIPGMAIPAGTHSNGLPIGTQLFAKHFDESTLFCIGNALK